MAYSAAVCFAKRWVLARAAKEAPPVAFLHPGDSQWLISQDTGLHETDKICILKWLRSTPNLVNRRQAEKCFHVRFQALWFQVEAASNSSVNSEQMENWLLNKELFGCSDGGFRDISQRIKNQRKLWMMGKVTPHLSVLRGCPKEIIDSPRCKVLAKAGGSKYQAPNDSGALK